jgi:hypothetical protein
MIVHTFYKAQPISDESTAASVEIVAALPESLTYPQSDAFFQDEAARLESILHSSLPGGTYDRLAGLMLDRKASHLKVAHSSF